jgi:REP element-mobilizing transposase RayT
MNRGIARRTLFENRQDIRTFMARLAWKVRAGWIEVHAFCVMTTHYHLLARSPRGQLSQAMCEVQREYSRWFNRTRGRDGPLFRGRFVSKRVDSEAYRRHLIRYIDFNPVSAGLTATPALHPYGSARLYHKRAGPPWLSREWVESLVRKSTGAPAYDAESYIRVFGQPLSTHLERLVEKRLALRSVKEDPLANLLDAARGQVEDWMARKARLADAMPVGCPVCEPEVVDLEIEAARASLGEWTIPVTRKNSDAWLQLHAVLLRDLCGCRWDQISTRLRLSESAPIRMYARHRRCVVSDVDYAERSARLAERALSRMHAERTR